MLGRQKSKRRVFNYIPRYYNQRNQKLINNRFGDSRFAEVYLKKKARGTNEEKTSENLSFSDHRKHSSYSRKKLPVNVLFLLVMVMLLVLLTYLLTSETFGILYK